MAGSTPTASAHHHEGKCAEGDSQTSLTLRKNVA